MDDSTFESFRRIVYKKSGIKLGDGKRSMVYSRLSKRLRTFGLEDYREYLRYLTGEGGEEETIQFLDVISTNVTSFFREEIHFEFLRKMFANALHENQRRFRFWCAACSTGEEPYSLVMTLMEAGGRPELDLKILATDISSRALNHALAGKYEMDRVKSVAPKLLKRYFNLSSENGRTHYVVSKAVRNWIVFRRLNLSSPPFPMRGPMDAVLCRNVMIYFDSEVRRKLVDEIYRLLRPGGYLIVGHSEGLIGMANGFRRVRPSIYVKQ